MADDEASQAPSQHFESEAVSDHGSCVNLAIPLAEPDPKAHTNNSQEGKQFYYRGWLIRLPQFTELVRFVKDGASSLSLPHFYFLILLAAGILILVRTVLTSLVAGVDALGYCLLFVVVVRIVVVLESRTLRDAAAVKSKNKPIEGPDSKLEDKKKEPEGRQDEAREKEGKDEGDSGVYESRTPSQAEEGAGEDDSNRGKSEGQVYEDESKLEAKIDGDESESEGQRQEPELLDYSRESWNEMAAITARRRSV